MCTFELLFGQIGSIVEIEEVGIQCRCGWFVPWVVVRLRVGMSQGYVWVRGTERGRGGRLKTKGSGELRLTSR